MSGRLLRPERLLWRSHGLPAAVLKPDAQSSLDGMRVTWICLVALSALLAGCSALDPAYEAKQNCEKQLLAKLATPSTYDPKKTTAFISVEGNEGYVSIEYDAQNLYGAPVRETETCLYNTKDHKWPAPDMLENTFGVPPVSDALESNAPTEGEKAADKAVDRAIAEANAEIKASKRANAKRPTKADIGEPMDDHEESPTGQAMCWQDYCPCEKPVNETDTMICRNLRGGLNVDDQMMAAGAAMRDAKRSVDRWKAENPGGF